MEWASYEPRSILNAVTKEGESVMMNGGSVPNVTRLGRREVDHLNGM